MSSPRYLEKFVSNVGGLSYTFPTDLYEWESSQNLRLADAEVVGANYPVDLLGVAPAARGAGEERVRFMIFKDAGVDLDTDVDTMKATLHRIGRGKLYTVDSTGNRRWAWARLVSMPNLALSIENIYHLPVALDFRRYSDWYAENATNVIQTYTTTGIKTFTVTNAGNAAVVDMVFRIRANAANGYQNPQITNQTTGQSFRVSGLGSTADHEIRVDTGRYAVELSTDDGVTYVNHYSNFTMDSTQVRFLQLEPGINTLAYSDNAGARNVRIELSFFATYY